MKKTLLIAMMLLVLGAFLASCGGETETTPSMESSSETTEINTVTTTEDTEPEVLPTEVLLSKEEIVLYIGSSYKVSAEVMPSDAPNRAVTFTSSDKDCVTVSSEGLITAQKAGKATVKATCQNGVEDSLTVTVIDEKDEEYYFFSSFSADQPNPEIEISHSTNARYEIKDGALHLITDQTDYINGKISFDNGVDGYLVAQASLMVQTNAFSNLFYFYTSDVTTDGVVCSVAAENGYFKYHNGSTWVNLEPCYLDTFYEFEVILRIGDRVSGSNKGCFDISIDGRWYRNLPLRKGGDGVEDSIRTFFFGSNKPDTHMVYDYLYLKEVQKPFIFLPENQVTLDLRETPEVKLDYELDGTPTPTVDITCAREDGWERNGDTLTFTKAGIYEFQLTAVNEYGRDSETLTVTVSAASASPEIFVREKEKTLSFKEGVAYTLDYTVFMGIPEGKKSITCNKPDGYTLDKDTVTFSKEGEYIFTVTVENSIGKVSETVTVRVVGERVVFEEDFTEKPEDAKLTQTGSGKVAFENGLYKVTTGSGSCQAFADIPMGTTLSEAYTASIDFTVNTNAFSNILFLLADGTAPASNGGICIAVENGTLKYHNGSSWLGIRDLTLGEKHNVTTVFDWVNKKQEIFLDGVSLGVFAVRNGNNAQKTTHLYLGSDKPNTDFTIDSIKIIYHGIVQEYWRRSVRANKDYEVQWTLGMRGAHDEGFTAANLNSAPWYSDSTKLLEEIIEAQRQILREELDNPTLEGVFQVFIPYKEVQSIYNQGLVLPDDVMIMWADDNHGFIRNIPNEEERARSGGHGVYYHNSYWGPDDESYMWLNTMPLTLFYEEMSKAIRYDADTAWVINVGDIKPGEISMEFLLDYAFHANEYNDDNIYSFIEKWAKREFPDADIDLIVSIEKRLAQYTNARKLEHMKVDLFTNVHFNDEFEKRLSDYKGLLDDAEKIYASLKDSKKAAFYETVLYQVRCAYYSNAEFFYATKANFAVEMGKSVTAYNCSRMAEWFNELKKYETEYYNKVLMDGKWDGIMTPEQHDPPVSPGYAEASPAIDLVQKGGGVIVENEYREEENSLLTFYNYAGGRKFVDVFSKGVEAFDFTVVSCPEFVTLSQKSGTVYDEVRLWVSVDFSKVTKTTEGDLVISYCDGKSKTVRIVARMDALSLEEKTYVEQDGYISVEAEHYSSVYNTDSAYFTTIKDLGRVRGDMIKVISKTLISVEPADILAAAPYVGYDLYFLNSGEFYTEVYRLPTLNAKGQVRFAVQIDGGEPVILTGESDYGVSNYAWEEGVFNQIIKHNLTVSIESAGKHTLRIYMIDPELCYDKIVIYTEGYKQSYFGPEESYNTTFNPTLDNSYRSVYETEFLPVLPESLKDKFGTGYFVEDNGQIRIEAAAVIEQSEFAFTTNNHLNGGFMISKTPGRYAMRTAKRDVSYVGKPAPTLNYVIYVEKGGSYTLSVEVMAPSPTCDSFIFAVDGKTILTKNDMFDYNRDEVYAWHSCGTVNLTAGVHTITVNAREDGLVISKIVLGSGSYSVSSADFAATVRTPHIGEGSKEDIASRKEILTLLDGVRALGSVSVGNELGDYSKASYEALVASVQRLTALLNSEQLISNAALAEEKAAFEKAYADMLSSRKMNDGTKDYLVYDDFEKNNSGNRPFGVAVFEEVGEPDGNVYREGELSFLALRAFKLQSKVQKLTMGYRFPETVDSGNMVMEARVRFNEAKWADIFRVQNESGQDAIVVAIERISNTESCIVAYHNTSKKILATYKTGEWVDIRLEIDIDRSVYNVYVNNEKANGHTFRFRNKSEGLSGVTFGVKDANTDLNIDRVLVYLED